jgi:hypothetical protein
MIVGTVSVGLGTVKLLHLRSNSTFVDTGIGKRIDLYGYAYRPSAGGYVPCRVLRYWNRASEANDKRTWVVVRFKDGLTVLDHTRLIKVFPDMGPLLRATKELSPGLWWVSARGLS